MFDLIVSPVEFSFMNTSQKAKLLTKLHDVYKDACNDAKQAFDDIKKFGEMADACKYDGGHLPDRGMIMAYPSSDFSLYAVRAKPHSRLTILLEAAKADENPEVQESAHSLSAEILEYVQNLKDGRGKL